MPIDTECAGCGKRYALPEKFAGRKARCKNCGAEMVIPQAQAVESPDVDYDAMAAMDGSGTVDESEPPMATIAPPPPPPRPAATGTTFAQRKVASPAVKQPFRLGFRLNRLVVLLIVGGGVLGFFGVREWRLSAASDATPQAMTCLQLEQNGPGKNAHIKLSGFFFSRFIYSKSGDNWTAIYAPTVAASSAYATQVNIKSIFGQMNQVSQVPVPTNVKVLIKSKNVHTQAEVESMARRGSITGMVINEVEGIGSKELSFLEKSYPAIDFSRCWIFEEGREPAPASKYLAMVGGGLLLVLVGLVVMLRPAS